MESSELKLNTDLDADNDITKPEFQYVRIRPERGKNGMFIGRTVTPSNWSRKKLKWIMVLSLTTVLALSAVVLYLYVQRKLYGQAAMVTNGVLCANVGVSMLKKNCSAVEATIATMICETVVNFEGTGIGGGFIMTIFNHQTKSASSLMAMEAVPLKENMNILINTMEGFKKKTFIAVPGELMGYWEAFQKHGSGNIKWADLFQPSIDLCVNGFEVTPHLVTLMEPLKKIIEATPSLSELLINPDTNTTWLAGDILRRPKMGATLKKIASEGIQAFYNGSVGDDFIADLKDFGSVMTKEDLENYQVHWEDTVISHFNEGITLYASPLHDTGPVLTFILNILDSFITVCDETTRYQRMIEAFKFAVAQWTRLEDLCFETSLGELVKNLTSKEYALKIRERIKDNETSNDPSYYGVYNLLSESKSMSDICVLAPNGDAVVVTISSNEFLGAKLRSVRTGIILNNQIRYNKFPGVKEKDCNSPQTTNYFTPHTIPIPSMSHSIFVDKQENVRLMLASSGGTHIIQIIAQVAIANLWLNYTLRDAINMPKMYHQLYPMEIHYHTGTNLTVLDGLKAIGHNMKEVYAKYGSITTGIAVQHGRIYTYSDDRVGWETSGF